MSNRGKQAKITRGTALHPKEKTMTTTIQENSHQKAYPLSEKSAWWGLFAVVVVMLSVLLSPSVFRMFGSTVWHIFGITEGQWSLFTALRGLFFVIFVLGAGVAGDFWGRRRILLFTQWVFIFLSFVIAFLPLGNRMVFTYILIGIFGTMVRTLTITIVILIFPQKTRLLGVMIYSTIAGIAYLISPLYSEYLLETFGTKLFFITPALLGVLGVWLVMKKIPESHSLLKGGHRDVVALALLAFSICVLIFSVILARSLGWRDPIILVGLVFGVGLFVVINRLLNVSRSKSWVFTLHV
jgi:MFS family permease